MGTDGRMAGRRDRRRQGGVGLAAALPGQRVTLFALQSFSLIKGLYTCPRVMGDARSPLGQTDANSSFPLSR